jgi:hypothetical protein
MSIGREECIVQKNQIIESPSKRAASVSHMKLQRKNKHDKAENIYMAYKLLSQVEPLVKSRH